ncbi:unnamed protein product [Anisakis simplex]|uniref:Secreted protein n=1 Tax=Anisakis simplex TaxID=6269 RepID=A0A0M3KE25_ANISI|nr:unnamed protein product [Anisakis simplex]
MTSRFRCFMLIAVFCLILLTLNGLLMSRGWEDGAMSMADPTLEINMSIAEKGDRCILPELDPWDPWMMRYRCLISVAEEDVRGDNWKEIQQNQTYHVECDFVETQCFLDDRLIYSNLHIQVAQRYL